MERARLLINVSGCLHAEKSILKIDAEEALRSYQINTIAHLLTYKHFVPLLPSKKSDGSNYDASQDPASGYIQPNLSVLASMSAKVGSLQDNKLGVRRLSSLICGILEVQIAIVYAC